MGEIKSRLMLQAGRDSSRFFSPVPRCSDVAYEHAAAREVLAFIDRYTHGIDPILQAGIFHCCMFHRYPGQPEYEKLNWLTTQALLRNSDPIGFELFCLERACLHSAERYSDPLNRMGEVQGSCSRIDCSEWLECFTESVLHELQRNAGKFSKRLNAPVLELHHRRILDYLERCGSVSLREYSAISVRSPSALKVDFESLLQLGLIESMGCGQGSYFVLAGMC